ncbi:MAG: hypothetical protein ABL998_09320 [Planctomycetota bacterium]
MKTALVTLVVVLAGGALALTVQWSSGARATHSESPSSPHEQATPSEAARVVLESPARAELPTTASPVPEAPVTIEEAASHGTATLASGADKSAVVRMLEDPSFVEACADPEAADPAVLARFVDEGRRVISAFQSEETERRVAAGLYERMEGYVPGEPFTTTSSSDDGPVSFSSDGSEMRRVAFSREDYPDLYALRDRLRGLERRQRSTSLPK